MVQYLSGRFLKWTMLIKLRQHESTLHHKKRGAFVVALFAGRNVACLQEKAIQVSVAQDVASNVDMLSAHELWQNWCTCQLSSSLML